MNQLDHPEDVEELRGGFCIGYISLTRLWRGATELGISSMWGGNELEKHFVLWMVEAYSMCNSLISSFHIVKFVCCWGIGSSKCVEIELL